MKKLFAFIAIAVVFTASAGTFKQVDAVATPKCYHCDPPGTSLCGPYTCCYVIPCPGPH